MELQTFCNIPKEDRVAVRLTKVKRRGDSAHHCKELPAY